MKLGDTTSLVTKEASEKHKDADMLIVVQLKWLGVRLKLKQTPRYLIKWYIKELYQKCQNPWV